MPKKDAAVCVCWLLYGQIYIMLAFVQAVSAGLALRLVASARATMGLFSRAFIAGLQMDMAGMRARRAKRAVELARLHEHLGFFSDTSMPYVSAGDREGRLASLQGNPAIGAGNLQESESHRLRIFNALSGGSTYNFCCYQIVTVDEFPLAATVVANERFSASASWLKLRRIF